MLTPLPILKPLFAVSFSFLGEISSVTYQIKITTKRLLFALITLFGVFNAFGQTTNTFTTPGAGTWTAPVGVTSVTVEVWGAGGAGQGTGLEGKPSAGGGGSGGGFVKTTYLISANNSYDFFIGPAGLGATGSNGGNSWFVNVAKILAIGGNGAGSKITSPNTSGTGAIAPTEGNIGGTLFSTYGGSGANGSVSNYSGGGGSSSGSTSSGNANGSTGGLAPTNGYNGANGITSNGVGGATIGGFGTGGSGAKKGTGSADYNGGNGGNGQIKITYTCPTYSAGPNQTLAACATTATLAATAVSSPATGNWTLISGSGSLTTASSATSGVTGIDPGTPSVFRWTVSNGSCGSSFSDVTLISPVPNATTVTGGGTFCGSTTITASGGTDGTIYFQGTTSGGTSTSTQSLSQVISLSGTYYFRSRSTSGCWGVEGSAVVIINSVLTAIAGTPNPVNAATGVCYTGTPITRVSWQAVPDITSYDVYFGAGSLPGNITANVTTTNYNIGTLAANTTYYWKIVPRNTCGITTGTPVIWSFTTSDAPCYCTPTISDPLNTYINSFKFVGTLNDNPTPNTSSGAGYANYTNLTPVVQQPQGSVLNIVASAVGSDGLPKGGFWKAWVDYNKDGVFSNAEQVYNLINFTTESLTFGFVIPSATPVGNYRFRIKVGDPNTFDSCSGSATGETEDYIFEVRADCSAKINTASLTDARRCGTGTVTLSAIGTETGTGTGIKWYAAASGGTSLFDGANFVTPVLTENTRATYYVVAYNATCESVFRIPVTAIANPGPTVAFNTVPAFCEATPGPQVISATNGKRLDVLLYEQFNAGLGAFIQSLPIIVSGSLSEPKTYWLNKPSPYIPLAKPTGDYEGLAPALSSGYTGGNFVISNTDYNRAGKLLNSIETPNLDTRAFDNLNLDFDLYYFTLITALDPANYFSIDYSINGTTWVNLQTINTNQGNPNIWQKITVALPPSLLNLTTVKIRFSSFSFGKSGSFKESIAAIDNVRISGIKDESSLFSWSSTVSGILFDKTCSTPLGALKAAEVCIKPTATDIENNTEFSVTSQASFSNGCPAVGTIVVPNNARIWDSTSTNNWATNNWKPGLVPPLADKCVIIRKPVYILANTDGVAKNVRVETTGKLNIAANASLTVTDFFRNEAADASNVIIESDGNLIQINEGININTGTITAKRTLNLSAGREQYNYLISPLEGQNLSVIYNSAGATASGVLYHNEATNKFYASSGAYIRGRGLAVKEPVKGFTPTTLDATFIGKPTNGTFPYTIVNSNNGDVNRGYNLIGNPYPSNIDLMTFYTMNGGTGGNINSTAYFWDIKANNKTIQQGDLYGGQSYGQLNMTSGTGTAGTGDAGFTKAPNRYVKTGQAFMIKSKIGSAALTFNNTIRTKLTGGTDFFGKTTKKTEISLDRYWLNMITPTNVASNIAVVYSPVGNNAFTEDDSRTMGGSDAIYSMVENEKVSINGRSNFLNTDIIPLGSQHFAAGNYTITLGDKEGIFAEGQNIYLKDKQTGIISNLNTGDYLFYANAGESTGRFEIIYVPETVLATDGTVKENLIVYRNGSDFVIKAKNEKITALDVFDGAGRLMMSSQPNSVEIVLPASQLVKGFYILKINQNGRISSKKIIK